MIRNFIGMDAVLGFRGGIARCEAQRHRVGSTSWSQSGRFNTSRGLLPSGGPIIPSRCIISRMRAARP
jgi:hypothetical protein